MKPSNIIKDIMKLRGFSYNTLSAKLGRSTGSAVSNPLARESGMKISTVLELLEAMDCELVIRSTLKDKSEWVVSK